MSYLRGAGHTTSLSEQAAHQSRGSRSCFAAKPALSITLPLPTSTSAAKPAVLNVFRASADHQAEARMHTLHREQGELTADRLSLRQEGAHPVASAKLRRTTTRAGRTGVGEALRLRAPRDPKARQQRAL